MSHNIAMFDEMIEAHPVLLARASNTQMQRSIYDLQ